MKPALWWPEGSYTDRFWRDYGPATFWSCPECSVPRRGRGPVFSNYFRVKPHWGDNPGPRCCDECGAVVRNLAEPELPIETVDKYEAARIRIQLSVGRFRTERYQELARRLLELEGEA